MIHIYFPWNNLGIRNSTPCLREEQETEFFKIYLKVINSQYETDISLLDVIELKPYQLSIKLTTSRLKMKDNQTCQRPIKSWFSTVYQLDNTRFSVLHPSIHYILWYELN